MCAVRGHPTYRRRAPNCRSPVSPSRWCGQAQTIHHRSPRGERQRPVQAGASGQCVACSCELWTFCQHRPGSTMKPGHGSPGSGIRSTGLTVDAGLPACQRQGPRTLARVVDGAERGGAAVAPGVLSTPPRSLIDGGLRGTREEPLVPPIHNLRTSERVTVACGRRATARRGPLKRTQRA